MMRRLPGARLVRRKTFIYSAAAGFALGVLVLGSYVMAARVFCVGLRSCPAAWEPYVIIFAAGVAGFTLISVLLGLAARAFYVAYYRNQI